MERNPNDGNQIPGQSGTGNTSSGTGGFGASGGGDYAGATTGTSGSYGETSGASQTGTGGSFGSATAEDRLQQAKEAGSQKLSKAKAKAGELKSTLADKLEQGAEKLRSRGQSGSFAGDTGSGSAAIAGDDRMADVSNRVAGGLQASADWIREADVDSMRTDVENQVKEHPGRTLLIAAGIGYLLGKTFRR